MKKIILLLLFLLSIITYSFAKGPRVLEPANPTCREITQILSYYSVRIYGDSNLNFQELWSFDQAIDYGHTLTISVKQAGTSCNYSSTKTITKENRRDLSGNFIYNVKVPLDSDYQVTLTLVSPCVYDWYMGMNVKFMWSKTVSSYTADVNMEFGKKSACSTTGNSLSGSESQTSPEAFRYIEVCREANMIQY
jgi:hypothetical protein